MEGHFYQIVRGDGVFIETPDAQKAKGVFHDLLVLGCPHEPELTEDEQQLRVHYHGPSLAIREIYTVDVIGTDGAPSTDHPIASSKRTPHRRVHRCDSRKARIPELGFRTKSLL
jgi:hypothetical protein